MPNLQILLRREHRKPEGIATVKQIASTLGIQPTGAGQASLSGEISQEVFEKMFSSPPPGASTTAAGASGSVSSAAYQPLPVPEPLRDYVESITVAPPHIYFANQ